MKLPSINMITQQEFCDHIEDDDFLLRYGNPVAKKTDEGKKCIGKGGAGGVTLK